MANPKLMATPFAENGIKNEIPDERLPTDPLEIASYNDGFPSITMTPIAAGGKAPQGKDFNGIFNEITSNISHVNKGGRYKFDAAFAALIGGYPSGAVLASNDLQTEYLSLVNNNLVNPNTATGSTFTNNWKLYGGDAAYLTRKEAVAAGIGANLATTNSYALDLDLLKTPGEYYFKAGETTQTQANAQARHAPLGNNGFVLYGLVKVWRETASVVYQYLHASENHVYVRRYGPDVATPTNWTQWAELLQTTNSKLLIAENGYMSHANGIIEQWGLAITGTDGYFDIVFPIAFPNAVFTLNCLHFGGSPVAFAEITGTVSNTGVRVFAMDTTSNASSFGFRWNAKGI